VQFSPVPVPSRAGQMHFRDIQGVGPNNLQIYHNFIAPKCLSVKHTARLLNNHSMRNKCLGDVVSQLVGELELHLEPLSWRVDSTSR
jgi:hypothetical protein